MHDPDPAAMPSYDRPTMLIQQPGRSGYWLAVLHMALLGGAFAAGVWCGLAWDGWMP